MGINVYFWMENFFFSGVSFIKQFFLLFLRLGAFLRWRFHFMIEYRSLPCISIAYFPIILLLLLIVPRDVDEPIPVFSRIFVVCCRSSMIIASSGVAGRAKGQIKLCEIIHFKYRLYRSYYIFHCSVFE